MTWLLTGGAGYIGAHVLRSLQAAGHSVVVVDDLSTGRITKVPTDVPFVPCDVRDRERLTCTMRAYGVDGVVHLAGKKAVADSVAQPLHYHRENVDGVLTLAEAMVECGVRRVVYSSSAYVYGAPDLEFITEDSPTLPFSPYGETKLVGEWVLRALAASEGMSVAALRYFNVAGAGADDLGDVAVHNLIPMVLRAYSHNEKSEIFGDDYPTFDGTCIRDYIHVADLAEAHVAAAELVSNHHAGFTPVNIGRGQGSSVREVIESVSRAIGEPLDPVVVGRRSGDPAHLVASVERARELLGWTASRDLDDMTRSAWSAWQADQAA